MPNDPKWRTIARAAKQTIPLVLAVYVHLLTIASGAVDRGTLMNVNSEDLASALDVDCASVDAVLQAMQGRVLDSGKLTGWEKRQVNREDSSTERVKKWRETKVKHNVTQSNAVKPDVTQVKHNVTADKSREEEIRTEQVQVPLASTALAVPAERGKLVCTLPLNQGDHEVFETDVQGWTALYPAVDVRQELRSIKGWALSNPTRRKTKGGIARFVNSWLSRITARQQETSIHSNKPKGLHESNIRKVLTILAERRQAQVSPGTLLTYSTDLASYSLDIIETACENLGKMRRAEGETAFPDIATILEAVRGVIRAQRPPEPSGFDKWNAYVDELMKDPEIKDRIAKLNARLSL